MIRKGEDKKRDKESLMPHDSEKSEFRIPVLTSHRGAFFFTEGSCMKLKRSFVDEFFEMCSDFDLRDAHHKRREYQNTHKEGYGNKMHISGEPRDLARFTRTDL